MPEESNFARQALERLGVDPDNLGCVMLDVELPEIYRSVLDPEKAYYSKRLSYVEGLEGDSHITLLYGLLLSAQHNRDLVDGVLDRWYKPMIIVPSSIDVFPGNDGDSEYSCLVIKPQDHEAAELQDANVRLSKLPHVRGFYNYDPHLTIGYVQKDYTDEALRKLDEVQPHVMRVGALNYGD